MAPAVLGNAVDEAFRPVVDDMMVAVRFREPGLLIKVAVGLIIVRYVDLFWLIAPEFHPAGVSVSWQDVVLPLTLGAIWLGCFIWQLRGRALLGDVQR